MLPIRDRGVHMGRGQHVTDGPSADGDAEDVDGSEGSLAYALGLTVASIFVWGVAHMVAGRRVAGLLLMTLFAALAGGGVIVVLDYREDLKQIAVRRDWLAGITIGILVLALVWAT